jgi:hypothetical protein
MIHPQLNVKHQTTVRSYLQLNCSLGFFRRLNYTVLTTQEPAEDRHRFTAIFIELP